MSGERINWVTDSVDPAVIESAHLKQTVACLASATLLVRHFPVKGARDEAALALSGMLLKGGFTLEQATRFVETVTVAAGCEDTAAKANKPGAVARAMRKGKHVAGATKLKSIFPSAVVDRVTEWLQLAPAANRDHRTSSTDAANAERFTAMHGKDVLYCTAWKRWLIWDESRWQVDGAAAIRIRAIETAKAIYSEVQQADGKDDQKELSRWAAASQQQSKLESMLWAAEPRLAVASDELDVDRWLLNVPNGTIDLRTGTCRKHERDDLLTKVTRVHYNADAVCPRWDQFLSEVMQNDEEMIGFLRRVAGYALTGLTNEQCLFLLLGPGANGKSTFVEVLRRLVGDYGQPTEFRTLIQRQNQDSVRNDLAALRGCRIVSAGEPNRRQKFDEALVKILTGGDMISTRFLYGEFFSYEPEFKLLLSMNEKPRIDGTDDGIWRRIHLVEFKITIPIDRQVANLTEVLLREEGSGILNWALQGCIEWQSGGLRVPDQVHEATQLYRRESDAFAAFLSDRCRCSVGDLDEKRALVISSRELAAEYEDWCKEMGEVPMTRRELSSVLQQRGFKNTSKWLNGRQDRVYIGLCLNRVYPF